MIRGAVSVCWFKWEREKKIKKSALRYSYIVSYHQSVYFGVLFCDELLMKCWSFYFLFSLNPQPSLRVPRQFLLQLVISYHSCKTTPGVNLFHSIKGVCMGLEYKYS